MKEGAENVQTKIQAKVESLKTVDANGKGMLILCMRSSSFIRIVNVGENYGMNWKTKYI